MISNPEAERGLLAAAILSHRARAVLERMQTSDFTDTRHRIIAATINEMTARDIGVDSLTLEAELRNRGKLSTPGGAGGTGFLANLVVGSTHVVPEHAEHYANDVRQATRIRLAHYAGDTLKGWMENEEAGGEFDDLIRRTRESLDAIPGPVSVVNDDSLDTVRAMLNEPDRPDDWLIPGLLSREERVVVVAGEGIAKTTLMRQFAVCLAGGLNPWTRKRVSNGLRVLYVDSENSRSQSTRAYRWIAPRCSSPVIAPGWKDRILHKTRNDGLDLPGIDAQWFIDTADRFCPDVLILGAAYKMMLGDPQKDRDVLALFAIIDKVRVQHKAAVLIETHSGNGGPQGREMRPYGSSVWRRWPEVGIGYYRDDTEGVVQYDKPRNLKMVEFRGARERRDWPDLIQYGSKNEMPWVPTRPDYMSSIDLGYQIGEAA